MRWCSGNVWHVTVYPLCVLVLPAVPRPAQPQPPLRLVAQCPDLRQCGSNLAASTHQLQWTHTAPVNSSAWGEGWDMIVITSTLFCQSKCFLRKTISCSWKYISGLWTWCYCIVLVMLCVGCRAPAGLGHARKPLHQRQPGQCRSGLYLSVWHRYLYLDRFFQIYFCL